jgi:hypothetical protein
MDRIESLKRDIESMENNNDGSLQWVDEIRELHQMLWDAEAEQNK